MMPRNPLNYRKIDFGAVEDGPKGYGQEQRQHWLWGYPRKESAKNSVHYLVGSFPDGKSALMLAAARLRHIVGIRWGVRQYLNMNRLKELDKEGRKTG